MPISFGNGPRANGKARQNQGRKIVDGHLPQLDHKSEDTGERAAFRAVEPRRVDLDHPRRAERLEVAVHAPNEGKRCERACKRCRTEHQVHDDGAGRANQHGDASANSVGQEPVDQLPDPVGHRPRAQNLRNLELAKTELRHQTRRGKSEIVPADVVRGVHEPKAHPIHATAGSKSRGILNAGVGRGRSGGLFHEFSFANTRSDSKPDRNGTGAEKSKKKVRSTPFGENKTGEDDPVGASSPVVDRPR